MLCALGPPSRTSWGRNALQDLGSLSGLLWVGGLAGGGGYRQFLTPGVLP